VRTLARFSFLHRRLVLALWIAAIALAGGSLTAVGTGYSDAFTLPDTESSRAFSLLERVSPDSSGDVLTAVFAVEEGSLTDPAAQERVEEVVAELAGLDGVVSVTSPYDAPQQVSQDGRTAFAPVQLDGIVPNDVSRDEVEALLQVADDSRGAVQVELTGQAATGPPEQGKEELVGLAAAAVVLFLVFGSLAAMSLPLITAVLSIGLSLAAVGLLSNTMTIATFAPTLSVLLGLGVGIDYALFIVTRYRQGLLEGRSPLEATVTAVDTSGRAVLFAGITVCIALLGLFALGLSILYGVAVASSLAVATTVLASLTLLPALLGLFGRRVLTRKQRAQEPGTAAELQEETRGWQRWAGVLTGIPRAIAAGAVLLHGGPRPPDRGACGSGLTDQGSDPGRRHHRGRATTCWPRASAPASTARCSSVTDLGDHRRHRAHERLVSGAAGTTRRWPVVTPTVWLGGTQPGQPRAGGSASPASTRVGARRTRRPATWSTASAPSSSRPPPGTAGRSLLVGGATAVFVDFSQVIADKLPLFVASSCC
jgi:RND superfamily putative drug exporter